MAGPAVAAAAKTAVAVVTDKNLCKIVGGIILGILFILLPVELRHHGYTSKSYYSSSSIFSAMRRKLFHQEKQQAMGYLS